MAFRERIRYTTPVGEESITKQSHKAECDIHNILKQYEKTGIITHVQSASPHYTDLPSDVDYQSAMNTLLAAQAAFAELPAKVRSHFDNDPQAFLAAFADPAQEETLRDFGLLEAAQASAPAGATTPAGGTADGSQAPS